MSTEFKQYKAIRDVAIDTGVDVSSVDGYSLQRFIEVCRLITIELGGTFEMRGKTLEQRKASALFQLATASGAAPELSGGARERQIQAVKAILDGNGIAYEIPQAAQDWRLYVLLRLMEFGAPLLSALLTHCKSNDGYTLTQDQVDPVKVDPAITLGNVNCLSFDGVDDELEMPSLPWDLGGVDYSVVSLIYTGALASNTYIVGKTAGVFNPGEGLCINAANNKLQLRHTDGSAYDDVYSSTVLATDTWYWVGVSFDSSTRAVNFYVNGVAAGSGTQDHQLLETTVPWKSMSNRGVQFSTCKMAYLGIAQRVLNASECSAMVENSLMSLPLSEGAGTTAGDVSNNGNGGTIVGATWVQEDGILAANALYGFGCDVQGVMPYRPALHEPTSAVFTFSTGTELNVVGLAGTETITNDGTSTLTAAAGKITGTDGTAYNIQIDGEDVYVITDSLSKSTTTIPSVHATWPDASVTTGAAGLDGAWAKRIADEDGVMVDSSYQLLTNAGGKISNNWEGDLRVINPAQLAPAGYVLISDGDQYIDTGWIPDGDAIFNLKARWEDVSVLGADKYSALCGVADSAGTNRRALPVRAFRYGSDPEIDFYAGWGASSAQNFGTADSEWHAWERRADKKLYKDGTLHRDTSAWTNYDRLETFYLGQGNFTSTSEVHLPVHIGRFTGTSTSSSVDMRPVPAGSQLYGASTVAPSNCMYNVTTDTYHENIGTGTFGIEVVLDPAHDSWWIDSSGDAIRRTHADFLARQNLSQDQIDVWEKFFGNCHVTELPIYEQGTIADMTSGQTAQAVRYQGNTSCGQCVDQLYDGIEQLFDGTQPLVD